MSTITLDAEIDMSDIDTDDLIDEIENRGYIVKKEDEVNHSSLLDHEKLNLIKDILGLKEYESKEKIINEIYFL